MVNDTKTKWAEYFFDDEVDDEKIKDVVAEAGLRLEEEWDNLHATGDFYDSSTYYSIADDPHARVSYKNKRNYRGGRVDDRFETEVRTEYVANPGDEENMIGIVTRVRLINREGYELQAATDRHLKEAQLILEGVLEDREDIPDHGIKN